MLLIIKSLLCKIFMHNISFYSSHGLWSSCFVASLRKFRGLAALCSECSEYNFVFTCACYLPGIVLSACQGKLTAVESIEAAEFEPPLTPTMTF